MKESKLKQLRAASGLTIKEVAKRAKVPFPTYARAERGGELTVRNALKISKFYGRTVEQLWGTA